MADKRGRKADGVRTGRKGAALTKEATRQGKVRKTGLLTRSARDGVLQGDKIGTEGGRRTRRLTTNEGGKIKEGSLLGGRVEEVAAEGGQAGETDRRVEDYAGRARDQYVTTFSE